MTPDYEKLGVFYLGREYDAANTQLKDELVLYDSKDLTTHAVCVGMTGSGKTGLCLSLLEEAAIDGVPAICIDPKGDLGNLLLAFPGLAPADFEPWVDAGEAARKGQSVAQYAAAAAESWKKGLAEWGQQPDRIARLHAAADVAIYTPGAETGLPLSVLAFGEAALAPAVVLFMVSNLMHFSFGAWLLDHRIKVTTVTRDLTDLLCDYFRVNSDSVYGHKLRFLVEAWRDTAYGPTPATADRPAKHDQYNRFLLDYDIRYRLRRLHHLFRKIDAASDDACIVRQGLTKPLNDLERLRRNHPLHVLQVGRREKQRLTFRALRVRQREFLPVEAHVVAQLPAPVREHDRTLDDRALVPCPRRPGPEVLESRVETRTFDGVAVRGVFTRHR